MKILLVDDEARFLQTMSKLLKKKGHEVFIASDGMEALETLKNNDIHVAILDVKMPGMDGIAALKEIKKLYPLIEVIMLTGHASIESAVDGLRFGALEYFIKPVRIEALMEKIEEASEKRHIEKRRIFEETQIK